MFGKKEITPEDISYGLTPFFNIHEPIKKAINNISSDPEVQERIYFEIFLLKIFSIDFSLHNAMGDTKEKAAIMEQLLIDVITKVPDGNPTVFIDSANKRQLEYSRALKTTHNFSPPFMVGKTFCEFLGRKPDSSVAFLGSTIFMEMITKMDVMIKEFKNYKIKL